MTEPTDSRARLLGVVTEYKRISAPEYKDISCAALIDPSASWVKSEPERITKSEAELTDMPV